LLKAESVPARDAASPSLSAEPGGDVPPDVIGVVDAAEEVEPDPAEVEGAAEELERANEKRRRGRPRDKSNPTPGSRLVERVMKELNLGTQVDLLRQIPMRQIKLDRNKLWRFKITGLNNEQLKQKWLRNDEYAAIEEALYRLLSRGLKKRGGSTPSASDGPAAGAPPAPE
jgi:hypothetical protein